MPLDNITELRKRVPGGKYALTRALAERARQIQSGDLPLTEVRIPNPLSVAIDEIVEGKVTFKFGAPGSALEPREDEAHPAESQAAAGEEKAADAA